MFAIGHFGIGYLIGKGSSKLLRTNLNLPLLLAVSVVPDLDLLLQPLDPLLFMHRGPSHSIITFTLFAAPFFLLYGKRALPYYFALVSHSLIGDIFTGGFEILWPASTMWFSYLDVSVHSLPNVIAEWILFAVTTPLMLINKDLRKLRQPPPINLLFLLVAAGAILGPVIALRYRGDAAIPLALVIPSVFWLLVFAYATLYQLWSSVRGPQPQPSSSELTHSSTEKNNKQPASGESRYRKFPNSFRKNRLKSLRPLTSKSKV